MATTQSPLWNGSATRDGFRPSSRLPSASLQLITERAMWQSSEYQQPECSATTRAPSGPAIVAVPVRRHSLQTSAGKVHFWQRSIQKVQTQSWRSELGLGRVGTAEQSMLDIAGRPDRGGVSVAAAQEALRALALVVDWNRALELATSQGSMASYRAAWFSDALVPDAPNPGILRRPVASRHLKPIGDTSRQRFGIRDD